MPESQRTESDFINKITGIILENISNEQFGVSELADRTGMSRSNLLRKLKKITDLSVSQFIRQVRLQKALEILKEGGLTVSEVSYQVGFSSTSYFIKCFRDQYGHPPGEVSKMDFSSDVDVQTTPKTSRNWYYYLAAFVLTALVLTAVIHIISEEKKPDKSIAVLPFRNDSNDSTNVYVINGLMESILSNLQKIEDLRVVSRTSVEKYRNSDKTIPEIAKELNVKYFIEGSGQKIGDQLFLNIQLIEAPSDKHLWAEQFKRDTKDIFKLQMEVAKNIAGHIQVIITPEEEERIEKVPTENMVAYDYFLKGLEKFHKGTRDGLEESIGYFEKALEYDPAFARASADIAIAYYMLDANQAVKKYGDKINQYADQALLNDPQLAQSLIAKAVFFISSDEAEMAVPYLEKALEYNPNSELVIGFLSDFYVNTKPDTRKYLEYALRGVQIDIASKDSVTESFAYLHLSNALIQCGFVDEAEKYINRSLQFNSNNLYSEYVKAYILYSKNKDLQQTKDMLVETLKKDSTRYDVIQETGKICYYMRDYKEAYHYYKWFMYIRNTYNIDAYRFENAKIALVYAQMGDKDANKLLDDYFNYAQNDKSIYKDLSLAAYNSYKGNAGLAIQHLQQFVQQDNFHYWILLFLKIDPLMDNIKDLPEFRKIYSEIEKKFNHNHQQLKEELEAQGLL